MADAGKNGSLEDNANHDNEARHSASDDGYEDGSDSDEDTKKKSKSRIAENLLVTSGLGGVAIMTFGTKDDQNKRNPAGKNTKRDDTDDDQSMQNPTGENTYAESDSGIESIVSTSSVTSVQMPVDILDDKEYARNDGALEGHGNLAAGEGASPENDKDKSESGKSKLGNAAKVATALGGTFKVLHTKDNLNKRKPTDENTKKENDSKMESVASNVNVTSDTSVQMQAEIQESVPGIETADISSPQSLQQHAFYKGGAEPMNFAFTRNSSIPQGRGQSAMASDPFQLFIYQGGHNRTKTLHISQDATIEQLTSKVFETIHLPREGQRLVCGAKELRPGTSNGTPLTIRDFNIHSESTINVLPRLLGGLITNRFKFTNVTRLALL